MTATIIHRHLLNGSDRQAIAGLSQLPEGASARTKIQLVVTQRDGERLERELPLSVVQAVGDLVGLLSARGGASIANEEAEISPEDAAILLGISRPIVMLRVKNGDLAHRMVGSHHKLLLSEVLAMSEREGAPRKALAELGEQTDDLVLQHGP